MTTATRALGLLLVLALGACSRVPGQLVPDVRSHPAVVLEMLRLARVGPDDVVYDLGSGDGRIVIAAAHEFGARGVGIEIHPGLVEESRRRARWYGVAGRVRILEGDLFTADLREATVVTLYLSGELNRRLRPKLLAELRPGARIVSQQFDMGDWPADARRQVQADGRTQELFLWIVPAPGRRS
jgi:SAM-dependent methyltransferase